MMRGPFMVAIALSAASCGRASKEDATPTPAVESVVLPIMPTARADAPVPPQDPPTRAAPSPRCKQPSLLSAEVVATQWPELIDHHVRLRVVRIERTVDFGLAIGVSGKERFAIVLAPDAVWTGDATKTFTVMGSRAVRISGGRSQLPELLLDEKDSCPR
jgi:hypothetical protein